MTHEQKPESAEFRTREAQVEEIMGAFRGVTHVDGGQFLTHMSKRDLETALKEAEARGAAEQRRKDEPEFEKIISERDDAEDFIRKMAETALGESVEWSNVYGFQNALNDVSERIFFLEKDTANVAALEARVKELEVASREYLEAQDIMQSKGILGASKDDFLRRNKARDELRAAAIREGGEK
ncbi:MULTISPECIES: hypothetical protein [Asaia]|uniref:hypothetical protein n=1 Tax=Asaia TaxID=91914 RepID=UPI002FC33582